MSLPVCPDQPENRLSHKIQVEGYPRNVGPTPGHLSECLLVTVRHFAEVFDTPWPPFTDEPEFPYCTCDDWSPE